MIPLVQCGNHQKFVHTVLLLLSLHCLEEFILWYNKSKSIPNLHKLSKIDMPKGTGRKGEKPPRKKKRGSTAYYTVSHQGTDSVAEQESMPTPSVHSSVTTVHSASNSVSNQWGTTPSCDTTSPWSPFPPNPWVHMFIHQEQCGYSYFASPQMANNFSFNSAVPYSSQVWNPSFGMPQPPGDVQQQRFTHEKNLHPFFVRFLIGNIRVCQGCRGSLRLPDGSVPSPPNDIAVVRLERRPYFDKSSGTWCQPQKETVTTI